MQLELKNPEGKVIGTIEFPTEEFLASLSNSSESEAQLRERDDRIAELEQEKAQLNERAELYDKLKEMLKTPEGFVEFAGHFGYSALIPEAKAKEEEEEHLEAGEEEIIAGKTDKPGYKYLPSMNVSVKVS